MAKPAEYAAFAPSRSRAPNSAAPALRPRVRRRAIAVKDVIRPVELDRARKLLHGVVPSRVLEVLVPTVLVLGRRHRLGRPRVEVSRARADG